MPDVQNYKREDFPELPDEEKAQAFIEYLKKIAPVFNSGNDKLEIVEIPDDEQKRIREILEIFGDYIEQHYFFDIIFSKKFAYLRPDKDGFVRQIDTADEMMDCMVDEIYNDVRALESEHMYAYMSAAEEEELRKRITPLIARLSDNDRYFAVLEDYIERLAFPDEDSEGGEGSEDEE